jgi:SAM-dependent methyltransferase
VKVRTSGEIRERAEIWQRLYYAQTAGEYDEHHVGPDAEHDLALALMSGVIEYLNIRSVLDVGSGTGRVVLFIKDRHPSVFVKGVEPVGALRDVSCTKGLSIGDLLPGDAGTLPFKNGSFDLVCAYGLLHHVARPSIAIAEMLRVASKAVFISDSNNFGQGSWPIRLVKQTLNWLRLWPVANAIKTRGKGYTISDLDGLSYSYSVFNDYRLIRTSCRSVHVLNTGPSVGVDPYRSATHVALLGLKP